MMARWLLILGRVAIVTFILFFVLVGIDLFRYDSIVGRYTPLVQEHLPPSLGGTKGLSEEAAAQYLHEKNVKKAPAFVRAIMNPDDTSFPRMSCPRMDTARYEYLRERSGAGADRPRWFFALNLINIVDLLPRLMGSIVETIEFLGPENCVVSVVEGRSNDGTAEVLEALGDPIRALNATYYFQKRDDINPNDGKRIIHLAELRNLALAPLAESAAGTFADDTNIIFLNDVAACPDDILELVHQKIQLGADMTCGFDWSHMRGYPTFYDVWVARAIDGSSFFYIPSNGSWEFAEDLFWSHPPSRARFDAFKPLQVFTCWNGGAVMDARPILDGRISFRANKEGECFQGEPTTFCRDLWHLGYGKIAAIPTVNLEYDDKYGAWIKGKRGYVGELLEKYPEDETFAIEWEGPPDRMRCIPGWGSQTWVPWDEYLDV